MLLLFPCLDLFVWWVCRIRPTWYKLHVAPGTVALGSQIPILMQIRCSDSKAEGGRKHEGKCEFAARNSMTSARHVEVNKATVAWICFQDTRA
jgi:hypothetical protein